MFRSTTEQPAYCVMLRKYWNKTIDKKLHKKPSIRFDEQIQ